jgi:hypothetical protein
MPVTTRAFTYYSWAYQQSGNFMKCQAKANAYPINPYAFYPLILN